MARLPDEGAAGPTWYRTPGVAAPVEAPGLDAEDADRLAECAARSETGSVLFVRASGAMLVLPPFAVERDAAFDALAPAGLVELLERPRAYAALLLRKGGMTVGFFRNEALVDSKTDRRFVKNRHRKGGQSQRRFDRIREKQVHELFGLTCETAMKTLAPYESEVQHVFFGGDRQTLLAFRKECAYFERFGDRVARRILPVAGDPRKASLDAVPREVWSSEVYLAGDWRPGIETGDVAPGRPT